VRRLGRIAFVGECQDETVLHVSPDLIRKGLTLIGSWHYNLFLFDRIMQVIQQTPGVSALISHVIPMTDIQGAFELSASHASANIILRPWE
jgi:L-iditol 2-dehydrogenase